MATINDNYLKLPGSYLFAEIARRVAAYKEANPDADIIRLGIGDVTQPLPQVCIEAMHKAVDEMSRTSTFRGYGPEAGYDFLREAIIKNDFAPRGIHLDPKEVFVNDGALVFSTRIYPATYGVSVDAAGENVTYHALNI